MTAEQLAQMQQNAATTSGVQANSTWTGNTTSQNISAESLLNENYKNASTTEELASAREALANYYASQDDKKWYESLANSAHQREVEDLKKAGLNPWLSTGSGASAEAIASNTNSSYSKIISNELTRSETVRNNIVKSITSAASMLMWALIMA